MAALHKSEQVLPVADSRVYMEQSLFTCAVENGLRIYKLGYDRIKPDTNSLAATAFAVSVGYVYRSIWTRRILLLHSLALVLHRSQRPSWPPSLITYKSMTSHHKHHTYFLAGFMVCFKFAVHHVCTPISSIIMSARPSLVVSLASLSPRPQFSV